MQVGSFLGKLQPVGRWLLVSALLLCVSPLGFGQDWARGMFDKTEHDFGIVPRGSKTEFEFTLTNKYKEPIHIASVRSSCGCTSPRVQKPELITYEKGAVIAEFNTRSFIGQKSAVVTVTFDRPYYAEVQLIVKGNIRSDILTEPGEVQFGEVDIGSAKSADVRVSRSGDPKWQIVDVRSTNQHLGVTLDRAVLGQNQVQYTMHVRLKDSAPAGDFTDEILIVTNERQYNQVTLPVRATVVPPLVIAPASVELGSIKLKTQKQSRLVLKAKQPFSIKNATCSDARVTFTIPTGEKNVHVLPLSFDSGETIGGFREKIVIETSLAGAPEAKAMVSGNVVAD